eukprot:GHVN01073413.1.p2 GENE.GHVN01073413.1~~GHVN01073413.1.p2  ORF type:complete len:276 (+),score=34.85 GHVN01073413.1:2745-3572(+)
MGFCKYQMSLPRHNMGLGFLVMSSKNFCGDNEHDHHHNNRVAGRGPPPPSCDKIEWEKWIVWLKERHCMREQKTLDKDAIWTVHKVPLPIRVDSVADSRPKEDRWLVAPPPGKPTSKRQSEGLSKLRKGPRRSQGSRSQSSSSSGGSTDGTSSSSSKERHHRKRKSKKRKNATKNSRRTKRRRPRSPTSSSEPDPIAPLKSEGSRSEDAVLSLIKAGEVEEVSASRAAGGSDTLRTMDECFIDGDSDDEIGPRPHDATQKLSQQALKLAGSLVID